MKKLLKILLGIPMFIINIIRPFKKVYEKTQKYYAEYQIFMQTSNMPEFGLIYHRFNPIGCATENYESDMYILNLNNGSYDDELKGTLYHEFTHIYDDEWFIKKHHISNNNSTKNKKWVYEEIHAEQIRTLYMLGVSVINNVPEITYDKLMLGMGRKRISFHDYCIEHKETLISSVRFMKTINKNGKIKISISFCIKLVDCILYYIGIVSIYHKYCTYDIDNILDLSFIADYLGNGVKRLLEIYCNDNIEDISKETIIESGNIRWNIIKYIVEELKIVKVA